MASPLPDGGGVKSAQGPAFFTTVGTTGRLKGTVTWTRRGVKGVGVRCDSCVKSDDVKDSPAPPAVSLTPVVSSSGRGGAPHLGGLSLTSPGRLAVPEVAWVSL